MEIEIGYDRNELSNGRDELSITDLLEREFGMPLINVNKIVFKDNWNWDIDFEIPETHIVLSENQNLDSEKELINLFTTRSIEQLKQGITDDERQKMNSYFQQQLKEYKLFKLLFEAKNEMRDIDDKFEKECEALMEDISRGEFKKVIGYKFNLHISKYDETLNYERYVELFKDLEKEIKHFQLISRQDILRNTIKIISNIEDIIWGNQNAISKDVLVPDEKALKKQAYIIEEKFSKLIWEELLQEDLLNERTFKEWSKRALMVLFYGKLERIFACEIFEETEDDAKEVEKVQKMIQNVKNLMQPYSGLTEDGFINSFSKERKKFVRGDLYKLFYGLVQQNNWKLVDKLSETSGIMLVEGIYNGILHFMEYIICSKPTKNSALTEQEYEKMLYALYTFASAFAKIQIKCSGVSKSQIAELAYCCLFVIKIIVEKVSKGEKRKKENAWKIILLFGQIVDEFPWEEAEKIIKKVPVRRNNTGIYQNDLFEKLLYAEMNDTYIHSDAKTKEAQFYCYICKSVMYILNRAN